MRAAARHEDREVGHDRPAVPRGRGSGPPWTTNGGPRGTGRKPRHHDDYPHGAVMPV